MGQQSVSAYQNAMKETYGPGMRNSLNNSNPLLTEVVRKDDMEMDFEGMNAVWSIHTGRSTATGGRKEGVALPVSDRQRTSKAREDLAYIYKPIKITGQAKHATNTKAGAFASAIEFELKGADSDLKDDTARQLYSDGLTDGTNLQSGVVAVLTADPGTGTTWTVAGSTDSEMRYFFVNETFKVINPSGGAARTGTYTITAIDRAAKTLTTAEAADAGVASGDYVVRGDTAGNSFGGEVHGIRWILSDTKKVSGIDPATNPQWAALKFGSSTTAFSEVLLDQMTEGVETDGNGSTPDLYICEHAQRRKLASTLQSQKRYDGAQVTLTAGWKGLAVARGTLLADKYCPTTFVAAITPSELARFVNLDFTWDEDDNTGSVFFKAQDGTDAVEARYKVYHQMAALTRNAHSFATVSVPTF